MKVLNKLASAWETWALVTKRIKARLSHRKNSKMWNAIVVRGVMKKYLKIYASTFSNRFGNWARSHVKMFSCADSSNNRHQKQDDPKMDPGRRRLKLMPTIWMLMDSVWKCASCTFYKLCKSPMVEWQELWRSWPKENSQDLICGEQGPQPQKYPKKDWI